MSFLIVAEGCLFFLCLLVVIWKNLKRKKPIEYNGTTTDDLPTPRGGLLFLGNVLHMDSKKPHHQMYKWVQLGPLFVFKEFGKRGAGGVSICSSLF